MKKFSGKCRIAASGSALAIALLHISPAVAQDAPPAEEEQVVTTKSEVEDADNPELITVTGSRIRRTEFSSPAPIQIIDPELEQRKGVANTAELVLSSPLAAGSSQVTAAISSNFVTNGGPGAQTVSLRGLGAERTLVLLNGRRAGPAGVRGAVASFDLNVLPQSIVERVEILKDGASSIYGSDAVAGVVNLITKTDTDGLELDAFWSQPQKKGGEFYRASATFGKDWGNASFLASVDWSRREELARKDRKYLDCPEEYIFKEDGSRGDITDPRTGSFRCNGALWGHVWLYDYSYFYSYLPSNTIAGAYRPGLRNPNAAIARLQFNYPGDSLNTRIPALLAAQDPFQLGAPAGYFPVGYDPLSQAVQNQYSPFERNDSVFGKSETITAYLQGSLELTDNIELYAEAIHNERTSYQNGSRQFWQFGFTSDSTLPGIFGCNVRVNIACDPARAGDPAAVGFTGDYLLSPTTYTDHFDSSQKVEYTRIVAGVTGKFGDVLPNWQWDLYGQHSNNRGRYTNDQIYQDSIDAQDFRTRSCVGLVTTIRRAPCIDINWTDPQVLAGNFTPAQRDYLFGTETGFTKYNQSNAELIVSGDLFSWSQGTVAVSLGASIRKDSIDDTPGNITRGLRAGATDLDNPASYVNNAWGVTASGRTRGYSVTKELFGEIEIPLLKDKPFFQALTFNAAGRVTNVKSVREPDGFSDSDKGNWTYKLSGNWQVNDWLRFRGTYGTSYRAPALFESFLADQSSFASQRSVDPCIRWAANLAAGAISQRRADNCAAGIPGQIVGVPGTFTGGTTSATVFTGGGIGLLEPETSKALSASVILTPRLSFLPDTRINLAVDYFKIEVNGEIAQLGAGNVVRGCYDSEFFPTDPLCSLFTRGQTAAPLAINTIRNNFLNVNSQVNEGIDVSFNLNHDLGNLGKLFLTAQMTWQLKDTVALFAGTVQDDNGEIGDPKWIGDFNMGWEKDGWSLLYGLDVIGASSDIGDALRAGGATVVQRGDLVCTNTSNPATTISDIYGPFCRALTTNAEFYHTLSLTKEFKNFTVSLGVSNFTNNKPPRVSTVSGPSAGTFGQSVATSQYDLIGRRGFLNVKAKF